MLRGKRESNRFRALLTSDCKEKVSRKGLHFLSHSNNLSPVLFISPCCMHLRDVHSRRGETGQDNSIQRCHALPLVLWFLAPLMEQELLSEVTEIFCMVAKATF